MLPRERIENTERQMLSPLAALAAESKGREVPEKPCDFRTDFQRDRDRVLHCKAFRRLRHKTQVFFPLDFKKFHHFRQNQAFLRVFSKSFSCSSVRPE